MLMTQWSGSIGMVQTAVLISNHIFTLNVERLHAPVKLVLSHPDNWIVKMFHWRSYTRLTNLNYHNRPTQAVAHK